MFEAGNRRPQAESSQISISQLFERLHESPFFLGVSQGSTNSNRFHHLIPDGVQSFDINYYSTMDETHIVLMLYREGAYFDKKPRQIAWLYKKGPTEFALFEEIKGRDNGAEQIKEGIDALPPIAKLFEHLPPSPYKPGRKQENL